jgi:hypothetical protein
MMGPLLLRLRLQLAALGPLAGAAAVLCLVGAAALAWLLPQRALQAERQAVLLGLAATPAAAVKSAPAVANENLALFEDVLGEQRYAEQQVKTLFGLAAKTGLTLSQGEYKDSYDQNARLYTYQVSLPVKGSYRAIWQFGLLALRAMPFASLDEISFKREAIGQANVEARLRLTLYLAGPPPGALP